MKEVLPDFAVRRAQMVDRDIATRGISDRRVLEAMGKVPRERFVPDDLAEYAYDDAPLPIPEDQTISQPLIVATMAEAAALGPQDRVLEIGTGSGYGAAVLGELAAEVWSVERHPALASSARDRILRLGYRNVHVVVGDGTLGWPDAAPFDAIVVTAGGPAVPEALWAQLSDGGRIVMPVGAERRRQELLRVRRSGDRRLDEALGPVHFVPLIGAQGWSAPPPPRRRGSGTTRVGARPEGADPGARPHPSGASRAEPDLHDT